MHTLVPVGTNPGNRLLHLTTLWSGVGRGGFRARALIERFQSEGWEVLVRYMFVEDRPAAIAKNPALESDATDAAELDSFRPTVVLSEGGLLAAETRDWKMPAKIAVDYVESGGVFLVLDAGRHVFGDQPGLAGETAFFGARVRPTDSGSIRYLRDEASNFGHGSNLLCRPENMVVDEWLRPALHDIRALMAVTPVALEPWGVLGDIAASTEPTATALAEDLFVADRQQTPIATVKQHGLGYAGIVSAIMSPDDLVKDAPDNVTWLFQLSKLLAGEAGRLRSIRGKRESRPPWKGDPRPTHDLLTAAEDETLEIKQTARFDVRRKVKSTYIETEVVEAVAELWNRDGGTLLIGVADEPRRAVGLDDDYRLVKPQNADGYCAWLGTLLSNRLSTTLAISCRIAVERVDSTEIARIDIPTGHVPAWIDNRTFRVRRSNAGVTLEGPELDQYLRDRFPST
jgi:hypothetical protein